MPVDGRPRCPRGAALRDGALASACRDRDGLRRGPPRARGLGGHPAGRTGAARALDPARDVLSLAAATVGGAIWTRMPGSRDVVFADLMLWGWLRRSVAERRLAQAEKLMGDDVAGPQPRGADRPQRAARSARQPHLRPLPARHPPRGADRHHDGAVRGRGRQGPHRRRAARRRQAVHAARGPLQARPPDRHGVRDRSSATRSTAPRWPPASATPRSPR